MRIKGEVIHKGNIVPVEVEVKLGWLNCNAVVIHVPESYVAGDLIHMVDIKPDLPDIIRPFKDDKCCRSTLVGE